MGNSFRNIDFFKSLYESLRSYFAVNASGNLSLLYKYCSCFMGPLVTPFANYVAFRNTEALVAGCKWQIGQLTNLLNYLYDPVLMRIFITQAAIQVKALDTFNYNALLQTQTFADNVAIQLREFFDQANTSDVSIHVPVNSDIPGITAVIEQIRIQGIPYQILTF